MQNDLRKIFIDLFHTRKIIISFLIWHLFLTLVDDFIITFTIKQVKCQYQKICGYKAYFLILNVDNIISEVIHYS